MHFQNKNITKLGQLFDEKAKEARNAPYDKKLVNLANNIKLDIMNIDYDLIKEDIVFLGNTKTVKMAQITQKDLYEDAILYRSREHSYKTKWANELQILIMWEEVWDSVHNYENIFFYLRKGLTTSQEYLLWRSSKQPTTNP